MSGAVIIIITPPPPPPTKPSGSQQQRAAVSTSVGALRHLVTFDGGPPLGRWACIKAGIALAIAGFRA